MTAAQLAYERHFDYIGREVNRLRWIHVSANFHPPEGHVLSFITSELTTCRQPVFFDFVLLPFREKTCDAEAGQF